MAFVVGDRPVRPLTADDVMRMVDAGILSEDERVELLHGALVEVSPPSPEHAAVKARLVEWLFAPERYAVRTEDALVVPDRTSLPEPDIAVVERGEYLHAHPATAHLVIEIAIASRTIDTKVKPPLYAAGGVPEYWVVDVPARRLRVFREPRADGYGSETIVGPEGRLEPLAVDVAPLDLGELFRGL
jgi:Uma2 family endonuclease